MCSRLLGFTANYPQELSNARGLKCFKRIPKRLFHRSQETQNSIWTMEMLQRHKTILVAATFCGYEKSWHNDQPCKKKCTKNYCLFFCGHIASLRAFAATWNQEFYYFIYRNTYAIHVIVNLKRLLIYFKTLRFSDHS